MARGEVLLALLCLVAASALATSAGARGRWSACTSSRRGISPSRSLITARVMSVVFPDSKGNLADVVVLGKDTIRSICRGASCTELLRAASSSTEKSTYHIHMYRNDGNNTMGLSPASSVIGMSLQTASCDLQFR
uniref:Uncharacterized protein n=1 Tax=Setaria viridis TaxID=4556 RepID=A0A4U6UWQ3_SETVI|nr:hypothetical protein SEVIR_4G053100v2 [Setaria viridis]